MRYPVSLKVRNPAYRGPNTSPQDMSASALQPRIADVVAKNNNAHQARYDGEHL